MGDAERGEGGAAMAPVKKDPPKGAAGAAFTAMKRVVDAGWSPTLNFSARMARQGAKTDAQIVDVQNLAAEQPDRVRTLEAAWKQWNAELMEPLWMDPKPMR